MLFAFQYFLLINGQRFDAFVDDSPFLFFLLLYLGFIKSGVKFVSPLLGYGILEDNFLLKLGGEGLVHKNKINENK